MEPEGSWPCSQQPVTARHNHSAPSHPIFKAHFNFGPINHTRLNLPSGLFPSAFSLQRSTSKPRTNFSYPPCVPHAWSFHSPGFEYPKDAWSSSFCIYPPVISSFNASASSWTHYSRIPLACTYLCVSNRFHPRITGQTKSQFRFADGKQASHIYWMPRIYIIVQWRQSFSKF
jgi:hypothetical protein